MTRHRLTPRGFTATLAAGCLAAVALAGCQDEGDSAGARPASTPPSAAPAATGPAASPSASPVTPAGTPAGTPSAAGSRPPAPRGTHRPGPRLLPGMPAYPDPHNVYAAAAAGRVRADVARDRHLVYVPNGISDTVQEIDPATHRIVRTIRVGHLPQHIVPSYDMRTLWVTDDESNDLIALDPRTGRELRRVAVTDPYNLYFTPDGRFAMVMAERLRRIDFRDAHTMRIRHRLDVGCAGVDHGDFTADGRYFLASCEFDGRMVVVDVVRQRVVRYVRLGSASWAPQDVKLSPDGRTFYVADMHLGGVWRIDARTWHLLGRVFTGRGAHGLYLSRDARTLYVTNRDEGSVSLLDLRTGRVRRTWHIPPSARGLPASPDMGNLSADGRVLWLSGRYGSEVYALDPRTGRLLARVHTGTGPHGLCVWPQPGRYSVGHTGITR